ncbi:hypothetical protein [Sphingosinicella rhizophila]|uniref:Secreted protein n=1 Tax=Sphingosinicella rhizophila TaxID=3050082 RepID=A0ABU3Q764_9SPHN|nr:hypothetical protein [Sphingosinicella sp. GR2756]MDT9599235.1 hypothetical protein [Sphingosinicella sp. GR2756]
MKRVTLETALAGMLLLSACDGDTGDLGGNRLASDAPVDVSAEGQAKDGRISMKGPGFDFAINLPGGLADHANVDGDDKILYPGSSISGMHIAAGEDGGKGGVELRFTSRDPLDKVVAWYRDPARSDGFTLGASSRDGDAIILAGKTKGDNNDFKLRLAPHGAGGAEGRLTIAERN